MLAGISQLQEQIPLESERIAVNPSATNGFPSGERKLIWQMIPGITLTAIDARPPCGTGEVRDNNVIPDTVAPGLGVAVNAQVKVDVGEGKTGVAEDPGFELGG